MRRQNGFSIVELAISMGIMLGITAAVFAMLSPSNGSFAVEPEVADMQQRLRVSTDTLARDLVMAGSGAYSGAFAGSLAYFFAPVLPFRQGLVNDDPPGTFRTDTITMMYVPTTNSQTSIATDMPSTSAELKATAETNQPADDEEAAGASDRPVHELRSVRAQPTAGIWRGRELRVPKRRHADAGAEARRFVGRRQPERARAAHSGAADRWPVVSGRGQSQPLGRGPAAHPQDRHPHSRAVVKRRPPRAGGGAVHLRRHLEGPVPVRPR